MSRVINEKRNAQKKNEWNDRKQCKPFSNIARTNNTSTVIWKILIDLVSIQYHHSNIILQRHN